MINEYILNTIPLPNNPIMSTTCSIYDIDGQLVAFCKKDTFKKAVHQVVDFDNSFVTFCQKKTFKQLVRDAINEENYWRDMLHKCNVTTMVDDRLKSELPRKVEHHVNNLVPSVVQNQFRQLSNYYTTYDLPSLVQKLINEKMPVYLNDNNRMQTLLNEHKEKLNLQLVQTASETLARLVDEPQYHAVQKAHLHAIDSHVDLKIRDTDQLIGKMLSSNEQKINNQLNDMQTQATRKLSELQTEINKIGQLTTQVDKLVNKVKTLEEKNYYKNLYIGGLSVTVFGIIATGICFIIKS